MSTILMFVLLYLFNGLLILRYFEKEEVTHRTFRQATGFCLFYPIFIAAIVLAKVFDMMDL